MILPTKERLPINLSPLITIKNSLRKLKILNSGRWTYAIIFWCRVSFPQYTAVLDEQVEKTVVVYSLLPFLANLFMYIFQTEASETFDYVFGV